jgi:hypothetical protein
LRSRVTLLVVAAVGVLVALAVADALRSGRSSSAAGTTLVETTFAPTIKTASTSSTSTLDVAPGTKACGSFRIAPAGEYPLLVVEVVVGDVSCQDARRVMKTHYIGGEKGSWSCHGPEGDAGCEKPSGGAVSARFADALDPEWEIDRIANRWAQAFAAGNRSCFHMTQPLCERTACERVGGFKIPNCTPPTTAYRKSFDGVTVEEIAIKGQRVAARFSNGEVVGFFGDGGTWWVQRLGRNADRGFFE